MNKIVKECKKLIDTNWIKEDTTIQELERFDNLCYIANLIDDTIKHCDKILKNN